MYRNDKTILVTGATGRQGGAVAKALLRDGWRVRIFTRDASKLAARNLVSLGAQAAEGDLDEPSTIKQALAGCYGAFSVQDFYQAGIEGEVRQGRSVADLARQAGVKHLVYTSVGAAEKNTGIPFFESKREIEKHVQGLGITWTILRPVFFFENFMTYQKDNVLAGKLSLAIKPDRTLQMIAVDDIGVAAATAFDQPDTYVGQAIDLAGDELTMPQVASLLTDTIGRPVRFDSTPIAQVRAINADLAIMYQWFNDVGYSVDIQALRKIFPNLVDFRTWLKISEWASLREMAVMT